MSNQAMRTWARFVSAKLRRVVVEEKVDCTNWAHAHADTFQRCLGARYIMYGKWLYAKHTVYTMHSPASYWLEFDVLDTDTGAVLSTKRRRFGHTLAVPSYRFKQRRRLQRLHLRSYPCICAPSRWVGHGEWLDLVCSLVRSQQVDRVEKERSVHAKCKSGALLVPWDASVHFMRPHWGIFGPRGNVAKAPQILVMVSK